MGILIRINFRRDWDGTGLLMNRHYKPTGKYTMRPVETIKTTQDAQARVDHWAAWEAGVRQWERERELQEGARDGVYQPSDFKD